MSAVPIKVWSGAEWLDIGVQGGTVLYQNEAPASPQTGMIWIDADSETSVLNDEDYLTLSTASATYAPSASPTFTGEVNLPATTNYNSELLSDTLASKLPYSYGTATPSTTDSGFLWYDSNSTPAAPKFWDGAAFQDFPAGLAHIATESFSAVSSVSVNGCFTSAYDNYRIVLEETSSATGSLQFRLRASGSDNSSSVYDSAGVYHSGSIPASFGVENSTRWDFASTNLLTRWMTFDIMSPQLAAATKLNGTRGETSGAATVASVFAAVHTDGSVFDGFSIIPASGTITGIVRVYGYKD